jgi:NmrA-like family
VKRHLLPVVRAAKDAGVRHVVFLSLLGVEKNQVVPHAKVERFILEAGVPHTFLRPSFFMQNLSTTHRDDIREHHEIFVPAGQGRTGFIDARDIAAVAARTLLEDGHEGKVYDLTGSEALTYAEVAALITEVLGRPIRYPAPGALRFAARWYARQQPVAIIAVMTGIYTVCRPGARWHRHPRNPDAARPGAHFDAPVHPGPQGVLDVTVGPEARLTTAAAAGTCRARVRRQVTRERLGQHRVRDDGEVEQERRQVPWATRWAHSWENAPSLYWRLTGPNPYGLQWVACTSQKGGTQ